MPDYVVAFGVGLVASAAVGIVVWLISDIPLASTVGHTLALYGVALFVAGGFAGGGYTNFDTGAMGSLFDPRHQDEPQQGVNPGLGMTAQERMHKRLRPETNPRAFWQVVGGMMYLIIGLLIVMAWG